MSIFNSYVKLPEGINDHESYSYVTNDHRVFIGSHPSDSDQAISDFRVQKKTY